MYDLTLARNISFGSITDELVSEYTDAGITNVEISPGGLLPTFGDGDLPEVVRRIGILRDHGVTVQSVHLPFGWDWDASAVTPGQEYRIEIKVLVSTGETLTAYSGPIRF